MLKEAVNLLVLSYLLSVKREAARRYLRKMAHLLNADAMPAVVALRASPGVQAEMRLWLRERLSVWMAEVGA